MKELHEYEEQVTGEVCRRCGTSRSTRANGTHLYRTPAGEWSEEEPACGAEPPVSRRPGQV